MVMLLGELRCQLSWDKIVGVLLLSLDSLVGLGTETKRYLLTTLVLVLVVARRMVGGSEVCAHYWGW